MKTVERKECKTVLENICSVNFVTECDDKTSNNEIDSYGAPKAPLLRSKHQVFDLGLLGFNLGLLGLGIFQGEEFEENIGSG